MPRPIWARRLRADSEGVGGGTGSRQAGDCQKCCVCEEPSKTSIPPATGDRWGPQNRLSPPDIDKILTHRPACCTRLRRYASNVHEEKFNEEENVIFQDLRDLT